MQMKRTLKLAAFSSLLLLLAACSNKKSGPAYTLKMKLAPGDHFAQNAELKMEMDMEAAGQHVKMNMNGATGANFEVLTDSAGLKRLQMTYTRMDMTMDMDVPGADPEMMNERMKDVAAAMVGKKITIVLDSLNRIVESQGLTEILTADSMMSEMQRDVVAKLFDKDQLNQAFGQMFQMYPDKPVQVGDSWTRDLDIAMGGVKMKAKMTYELKSVSDNVAAISINGVIDGEGAMNSVGTDMKMTMKGSQEGETKLDVGSGYMQSASVNGDIKANANAAGVKIPMTIKMKVITSGK